MKLGAPANLQKKITNHCVSRTTGGLEGDLGANGDLRKMIN